MTKWAMGVCLTLSPLTFASVRSPPNSASREGQWLPQGRGITGTVHCSFAGKLIGTRQPRCECVSPFLGSRCNELPDHPRDRTWETYGAAFQALGDMPWVVAQCESPMLTSWSRIPMADINSRAGTAAFSGPGRVVDCTDGLQEALNSPPGTLVYIPRLKSTSVWNVRGFGLNGSDLRIVLEYGVVVQAFKNATYMYGCDPVRDLSVFRRAERVSIAGYGATLRMWRDEYAADCNHSEFRAAMLVQRTANLTIAGLTVTHAGGDGMTVMGDRTPGVDATIGLTIYDTIFDNNYRQGISVISAIDMHVENTTMGNTFGTPPAHGVDFEPDKPEERLTNITFRNCTSRGNQGAGFGFDLTNLMNGSSWGSGLSPVTVRFENCVVEANLVGWAIEFAHPNLSGSIDVAGGFTTQTASHGIALYDKAASALGVTFSDHSLLNVSTSSLNCSELNAAKRCPAGAKNVPIALFVRAGNPSVEGQVIFRNVSVWDHRFRPWVQVIGDVRGWQHVTFSSVSVSNPSGCMSNTSLAYGGQPVPAGVINGLEAVKCTKDME